MDGNVHGCFPILHLANLIMDGMVRIIQRGISIPSIPVEQEFCTDFSGILLMLPFINRKGYLE